MLINWVHDSHGHISSPGIFQTLEMTEQTRERLEDEITMLNRERGEITEQLNVVSNSHHPVTHNNL